MYFKMGPDGAIIGVCYFWDERDCIGITGWWISPSVASIEAWHVTGMPIQRHHQQTAGAHHTRAQSIRT